MRALIVRQAVVTAIVLLAIGVGLSAIASGGWAGVLVQAGWAVAFAAGIAGWSAWQRLRKVKRGFRAAVNPGLALVPVDPQAWPRIDWRALDDLAAQLEARGYRRLGDFTTNQKAQANRGMARFLSDPEETRIVELQQFERLAPARGLADEVFKVHVTMGSVIAGRIKVVVSDRPILPASYMLRNENAVFASHPGKSLLELLELHRRLCEETARRVGRPVDAGYTLERYGRLERERQRDLALRIERSSAWALLTEYDRFVREPLASYAPSEARLASIAPRGWDAIDPGGAPVTAAAASRTAIPDPALAAARARMASGAQWFYWIAALSAVNAVSAAFGSHWGFVIGLGISQVLNVAAGMVATPFGLAIVWILNAASIAVFALMGWLAQRPSIAAFTIGITLFALDTAIFLLARDWIGVAFHGLALYFLAKGLAAARDMKRLAGVAEPAAAAAG